MAKQRPQQTSSGESGSFDKALTEDVDGMHKAPNQWTQARNAVNNTIKGDVGELSNEASNYLCTTAPYTIIGNIHIGGDEWAIFSTDDTDSEIGIFKEDSCTYVTVVNDTCLNFNRENLIKGVGRTAHDCGRKTYWDDGRNPTRVLDLDDIPWVQDCQVIDSCNICEDTDVLDCDKIRLAPIFQDLAFHTQRGNSSGQLLNGSYYVVGAYLIEGVRVTDFSLPSNITPLFTHNNLSSSLDIIITEADQEFDEFELALVQIANYNTVVKIIGTYSTRQKLITLDTLDQKLPALEGSVATILQNNNIVDRSDAVFRNGPYLIRTGATDKLDFNYQPLANQITTKWASVEYNAEYYRDAGSNVGYMRDEVYSFFIRWKYNTGDKSNSYHIPGRVGTLQEMGIVAGSDVLPDDDGLIPGDPVQYWQVYNTATVDPIPALGNQEILPDEGVIIATGDMAFWESSEIYDDDNPDMWNAGTGNLAYDLCGKRIRHHKFPDNATDPSAAIVTNHYDPVDGDKIRIMGVQFDNIQAPVDNNGNVLTNVVGYEILRGSREGNKTVLAKGMINNMRSYSTVLADEPEDIKEYLYPNYPYNPTAPAPGSWEINDPSGAYPNGVVVDHFLSSTPTEYAGPGILQGQDSALNHTNAYLKDDVPLGIPYSGRYPLLSNIKQDIVTFHSPETNFREPFLSAKEIKVYGELHGTMEGRFEWPKDHPRHKFVTNTSFVLSAILGIGYAAIQTEGEKSSSHSRPSVDYGGTYAQVGVSTGSTGLLGPSAAGAVAMGTALTAAAALNGAANAALSHSMLSVLMSSVGINPNVALDAARATSGATAGAVGGAGSEEHYSRKHSAWESTPALLRALQGVPSFLSYWGEGLNKMLNIIYAFTPFRQFALQQVSHCFYNGFAEPDIGDMRRAIDYQQYVNPELQDFAKDFRINNIYRSRTVAIKFTELLKLPYKHVDGPDNTQALFSDVWDRDNDDLIWKKEESINKTFERPASSHYVAMKQRLDNQYGQIASIMQVPVSTDSTPVIQTKSNVLFNGDTYVGRYTEKNTMFFFYDWLKGQLDGATFDYKLRKMVTHPRFWMDTDPFDIGEFLRSLGTIFENNGGAAPASFDPFMVDPAQFAINTIGSSTYDCSAPIYACDCQHLTTGTTWTGPNPIQPAPPINPCTGIAPGLSTVTFESACQLVNAPYNGTNLMENICELEAEVYQLDLYYQFLEDCVCWIDTDGAPGTTDEGCNADNDIPNPTDLGITPPTEGYNGNYFPFYGVGEIDPNGGVGPSGGCDGLYQPYSNVTGGASGGPGCTACPTWTGAYKYFDEDGPKGKWARKIKRVNKKLSKAKKKLDKKKSKLFDKYMDGLDGEQGGFWSDLTDGIKTPNDKFAFDMRKAPKFSLAVKEAFMYLFNSGVRDFFVETEINIDYRDWGDKEEERHYDYRENTNLRNIFSTDHIKTGNYYKYDYSLSIGKIYHNYVSWSSVQARDYDPLLAESCYTYRPKRMLYSLQQGLENQKDNWRVFLPLNYKDFTSKPVAVKPIGKNGALILFDTESPVQFQGSEQLDLNSGTKLTIGDGALFTQAMQNLANAEYPHEYGSCQNRLAIANTPAGMYYMSQNQGKIFQVGQQLKEISNQGMKWWFAKYLPYQLTQHPTAFRDADGDNREFTLNDNPVIGIGCQVIFDNENQIVFFCKKDWIIRDDIADELMWIEGTSFEVNGTGLIVELGDPNYFKPASWTVSYDPKAGGFIGYHDWHPDLVLPSKKTYMTTKKDGLWVHADRCDSYCNFYGIDYPFEVEYALHTQNQVNTLRNVMYMMEVYAYAENCDDRFHVLDFNFDEAVVYNSEQVSGLLKLNLSPKNNAPELVTYPRINFADIDILYDKEEQKYRFNQFFDITDDRGEFSTAERTIFNTEANGYIKILNPNNLNYDKAQLERKKFRHYKNTVLLRRLVSGNRNMIVALAVQMNLNSPR